MKFYSCAVWPKGTFRCQGDYTEDSHSSEAQAEGVCALLRREGAGGERKVFPLDTWVVPLADGVVDPGPEARRAAREAGDSRQAVAERMGKVAYNAYCGFRGWKSARGDALPSWDDAEEGIREAWRHAGLAVAKVREREKIREFTSEGFAGVLPSGGVVDRRIHPEAIPVPENALLGVPKPKELNHEGHGGHQG